MIIDITTRMQYAGHVHKPVNESLDVGKVTLSAEEERILRNLKREREIVQPVCMGKIINYNDRKNNTPKEKREKSQMRYNEWGEIREFSENGEEIDTTV